MASKTRPAIELSPRGTRVPRSRANSGRWAADAVRLISPTVNRSASATATVRGNIGFLLALSFQLSAFSSRPAGIQYRANRPVCPDVLSGGLGLLDENLEDRGGRGARVPEPVRGAFGHEVRFPRLGRDRR